MKHLKTALRLSTAFASAAVVIGSAHAQQATADPAPNVTAPIGAANNAQTVAPDPASQTGDIVVTGRGRKESLQSIPISVSSFSAQNIKDAGIERPSDFIGLTPNVSVAESQQPGLAFITIRGISQVRNGESPVAVVVDGVLQTISNQFNTELFDLQQIEVLKGPQGALFGRNAIGGAIVITTREPSNKFDGGVTLGVGNGGQQKAQLGVSGPIIRDKLFASLSGSFKDRDGYLENIYLNNKVDRYKDRAIRGRLIYTPTDNLKIDYRASFDETTSGALYFKRNNVNAAGFYVNAPSIKSTAGRPGSPDDLGPPLVSNVDGSALRQIFTTALKIDLTTPIGTLTSTSAYDRVREWDKGDASPYTSAAIGTQSSDFIWHAKSTELRLTSESDQPFRYIVGGYYLDLTRYANRNTGQDKGAGIVLLGYNDAVSTNPSTSNTADDSHQQSYALFAQANYDLTSRLELSGALRYDHDKRDTLNISQIKNAGSLATYLPVGVPGKSRNASFDAWQPKATLRYKINSGSSLYASYSKGFRSGGFNQDGVRAVALRSNANTAVTDDYKKEISTSYEIGFKSQFFDRKITLNGAGFITNFRNSQYFVFLPEAGAQLISNIDKSKMKGYEFDVNVKPFQNWQVFGNVGYTWSEIDSYAALPASVGKKMPYVPKLGFNVGTQYTYALSDRLDLTSRVDVHHKGSQFWETLNTAGPRSAFNLYDARVSIGPSDGKWQAAAWIKNAFNKKYNAEFVSGGFVQQGEPRTFGMDVSYRF